MQVKVDFLFVRLTYEQNQISPHDTFLSKPAYWENYQIVYILRRQIYTRLPQPLISLYLLDVALVKHISHTSNMPGNTNLPMRSVAVPT